MRDHKVQSIFSDFSFATTPPSITVRSQSNAPHLSTSNNDEDDDWGDFIRSPVPSHTQPSPPTSFDPFSPSQPESNPTRSLWEKPKGALPLSIFGEAEEENEEQGFAVTHPPTGSEISGSVSGFGVISRSVSLPNKSSLIVKGAGFGLEGSSGTAKSDSNTKGFDDYDDEGWEFKAAGSVEQLTDGKAVNAELGVAGNGSLSGLNSSWDAFSFDQIGSAKSGSQPMSGRHGMGFDFYDGNKKSGNDNDWGFVGAESVSQVGYANAKQVELDSGENGSKFNSLTGLKLNENAFSFDQIGLAKSDSQPKSDTNGMGFDFYDGNKKSGNDDDWGFVGAESVSQVGDGNSRADHRVENQGQAEFSFGIDNSAHSPKTSNVTSPGQWAFGFDVNPITLIQDGSTSKLYSKGKSNHSLNGADSSPAGKNIVTDEELWGFKDAPNGTASGHDSSVARKDSNTDEDFWDFKDAGKPDDAASGHDTSLSRKDDNPDEDSWDFKDEGKPDNTANGHDASISMKDDITDEDFWNFKDAGEPDDAANGHDASLTSKKFDDNDEDFWGFKDAGKSHDGSNAHDSSLAKNDAYTEEDVWEFKDAFSEMKSEHQEDRKSPVSPAVIQQLQDNSNNNAVHALNDTSVASNGTPYQYGEWNFGLHSSSVSQGGVILHSSPKRNENGSKVVSKTFPANQIADSDEPLWIFESISESNVKQKEVPNVADVSAHSISPTSHTDIKQMEIKSEKKEALPLSLFSNQNLEADDTSSDEESILNSSSAFVKTSNISSSANISINDIISNLYNEADNQSPVKSSDLISKLSAANSDLVNGDDDIDDDSWEFKDAFCENKANNETSGPSIVESHSTITYKLELNECLEVFGRLKDELCFVVLCHLGNLQKTRSNGSLSSEDAEVARLDKEIEELYNELRQDNLISKDLQSEEASGNLQEVLGVLREPKFQVLESELQLSKNISVAEKDWRSAVKLLRHVALTLRILNMGSAEDQSNYVSTWFRVISICAEELKHAAFIWKQSLQTNVQSQILSNVRGKRYILAIGEVYRVVALIQASVKLYKPWILLSSVDLSNMHSVLSECSVLWSSSGLEEALRSISDIEDTEYEGTAESLLDSINCIHKFDEFELQNYVFSEQEHCCRLSLLKAGVAPGLKLETWNGENYFVKLVNLWGNIVSCDPPELPCLQVG